MGFFYKLIWNYGHHQNITAHLDSPRLESLSSYQSRMKQKSYLKVQLNAELLNSPGTQKKEKVCILITWKYLICFFVQECLVHLPLSPTNTEHCIIDLSHESEKNSALCSCLVPENWGILFGFIFWVVFKYVPNLGVLLSHYKSQQNS